MGVGVLYSGSGFGGKLEAGTGAGIYAGEARGEGDMDYSWGGIKL